MYKNAFTCGIPNSDKVGNIYSAALGVVCRKTRKRIESLADVTPEDNVVAEKLVEEGKIKVKLSGITSEIFIEATVKTDTDVCIVTIKKTHTNIVKIVLNDEIIFETEKKEEVSQEKEQEEFLIHKYTFKRNSRLCKNSGY